MGTMGTLMSKILWVHTGFKISSLLHEHWKLKLKTIRCIVNLVLLFNYLKNSSIFKAIETKIFPFLF